MLEAALPSALRLGLAGRRYPVSVAGGIAARWLKGDIRCPRRGARRQRQLSAHRDPDSIGVLGVDAAKRAPRPTRVRVVRVGQRLRPALDDLVVAGRPVLVTVPAGGRGLRRRRRRRSTARATTDRNRRERQHGSQSRQRQMPIHEASLRGALSSIPDWGRSCEIIEPRSPRRPRLPIEGRRVTPSVIVPRQTHPTAR